MQYLKVSIGIFAALAASRFIPHPPNFTSLIALSFYIPIFLGTRFIPALLACFVITDLFIGFHNVTFFTWGSVLIIGFVAKYFSKNFKTRLIGTFLGAVIFFIVSNFGVWVQGGYGYSIEGFFTCYIIAIPFFHYLTFHDILFINHRSVL